jgi:hypothetical protein
MEPVAHFGLGALTEVSHVQVRWLNGVTVTLPAPAVDTTLRVPYPGQ